MDDKKIFLAFTVAYACVYALLVLVPSITVFSIDFVFQTIEGSKQDNWSIGTMAYYYMLYVIPLIYVIITGIWFFRHRKNRGDKTGI